MGLPRILFPYLREGVYISLSWPSRLILILIIITVINNNIFILSPSRSSITSSISRHPIQSSFRYLRALHIRHRLFTYVTQISSYLSQLHHLSTLPKTLFRTIYTQCLRLHLPTPCPVSAPHRRGRISYEVPFPPLPPPPTLSPPI